MGAPTWAGPSSGRSRCQNRVVTAARPALVSLLVVEGIGAVVFGVLTVVIGESITPGFIPWRFAAAPFLFGLFALAVAGLLWKGHPSGIPLALVGQAMVTAGAIAGLISSGHPALVIALLFGIAGIILALVSRPTSSPTGRNV